MAWAKQFSSFCLREAEFIYMQKFENKTKQMPMTTTKNPGMLLTLKEHTVCFHVQSLMPSGIPGGLADTFLMLSRHAFIYLFINEEN